VKRSLRVGSLTAESGEKVQGHLQVVSMAGGYDVHIPATLINGENDGPVMNLHAGIHGDEYEGIRAIWKLSEEIRPKDLSGAIIATPIVHVAAYNAGFRESPVDGKNLARVFPGDPQGTTTDRLAYYFFDEVILKSEYTLGLHSGGFRYKFHPLVEYYHGGKSEVEEKARGVSQAFAVGPFDIIQRLPVPPHNVTATYTASMNGVAGVEPEMWGEGRCLPEHVEQYTDSVANSLHHIGMINENNERVKRIANAKEETKPDHVEGNWVLAKSGGLFVSDVKIREAVERDQLVGRILDDFGKLREEVRAPKTGFVGAMRTFSMIRPGDWAVLVEKPIVGE
jgi:uncharacterized protein